MNEYPDLNPDFIFAFPAYNVRNTEINAIIGRSQLRRLDDGNRRRTENLQLFLKHLDPDLYRTDFATEGSSNYAFTLILKEPNTVLCNRVMSLLRKKGVELPPGNCRGRQPASATLFAPIAGLQRLPVVSPGRSHTLLRFLYRQLSHTRSGSHPSFMRTSE